MSYHNELLSRRTDWDLTRWCGYLPSAGFGLWDVLCEATERGVDGDLEDILRWMSHYSSPFAVGASLIGDLDAPIEYNRTKREQRKLVRLFDKAGYRYPATSREMAHLGVRLGLYLRVTEGDTVRWRVPAALPLPTEVLPMTPRQRQDEDDYRGHQLWSIPACHVAEYLRDLGCPTDVVTNIANIAITTGEHPDTVRNALAYLADTRYERHWGRPLLRVLTFLNGRWRPADPERLVASEQCVLLPYWRGIYARYGLLWALECRAENHAPGHP